MRLQKCIHGKPVVQVPSHEVAKMHAWKASGAGMRSWLLNGFSEKKRPPNVEGVNIHTSHYPGMNMILIVLTKFGEKTLPEWDIQGQIRICAVV